MNQNNKEIHYQTETIALPSATGAGSYTKEYILNSAYTRCIGIAVLESKTGGISTYRIGLDDKDNRYISAVHKNLLQSDKAAGMSFKDRFLPMNIKADGHRIKVTTVLPEPITSDLEYDIVFLLTRDAQKV